MSSGKRVAIKKMDNIFEDETLKWGDTTVGMGNFPVAIYYKLMGPGFPELETI